MVYIIKCPKCMSNLIKKNGKRNGKQRYRCNQCGHVWEIGSKKKIKKGRNR